MEALNEHFQTHEGQAVLYSDAQILDDDTTIKDAIADCLGTEDPELKKVIPHSKRYRISRNFLGEWSGWQGKRKLHKFNNEAEADVWLKASE